MNWLAIAVGAVAGAWLRWRVNLWLAGASWPAATWVVNVVGSYLMGLLMASFELFSQLPQWLKLATVTGFLGALTTFSSLSWELFQALKQQQWPLAVVLAPLHLFSGLLACWLGWKTVLG